MFEIPQPIVEFFIRAGIDLIAVLLLLFGLFYPRYRDKELVTAGALFNIFAFSVLSILSLVSFSIAAGFGLFAILALFSLRSEQISKTEIAYFFGSISIAVICSIQGTSLQLVGIIIGFILLCVWIIDHPRILKAAYSIKVTLDKIDKTALSNHEIMRVELSERLGVDVRSYQILALDYIRDMASIKVNYVNNKEKQS